MTDHPGSPDLEQGKTPDPDRGTDDAEGWRVETRRKVDELRSLRDLLKRRCDEVDADDEL
jgi:hypothetical protein